MTARITIVGVGALGSHLAMLLRNAGSLTLIDMDRVESKNTLGQFHGKMGLGRNKAQALQQALLGLWGLKVDAVPHRLTDDNAATLLKTADLVLDCTDNVAARQVIQKAVRQLDKPCLHGALSADGSFGRILWTGQFIPDPEGTEGQATCEDGANLAFHALVAAQMAILSQTFLKQGRKIGVQLTTTSIVRLT